MGRAMVTSHTLHVASDGHVAILDSLIGPDSTDTTTTGTALHLHRLYELAVQASPPLIKRETLMDAAPGEPGAAGILGGHLVNLYAEWVLARVDLDLLPFLLLLAAAAAAAAAAASPTVESVLARLRPLLGGDAAASAATTTTLDVGEGTESMMVWASAKMLWRNGLRPSWGTSAQSRGPREFKGSW